MPGPRVPLSRATHVLLPLLGFDAAGRQRARADGFTTATWRRCACKPGRQVDWPGLCRAAGGVPCEAWDQRLDAVVTEHGVSQVWTRGRPHEAH